MGLNMKEKQAVTREYRPRYLKASKKEKKTLLDEFTKLTGYHRKSDVRLLSSTPVKQILTYIDGNIPTSSGEQWFFFTATASSQYIHFNTTGTLKEVYVQVYDSSGATVGNKTRLDSSTTPSAARSLRAGQMYYIRVMAWNNNYLGGNYKIGFTTSTTASTSWKGREGAVCPLRPCIKLKKGVCHGIIPT